MRCWLPRLSVGPLSLNDVTTTDQPPEPLLAAMAKAHIPTENHQFIRRITTAIGIAEYRAVVTPDKPYVVAKRHDGKHFGDVRREGSFCSRGMQLSLTGVCVNCD